MEKRLGITLKHSYVNRITAYLNSGMILTGNSDIIHRFLIGKTISNLLGSSNVKYNVLGEGMKVMLGIDGDPT